MSRGRCSPIDGWSCPGAVCPGGSPDKVTTRVLNINRTSGCGVAARAPHPMHRLDRLTGPSSTGHLKSKQLHGFQAGQGLQHQAGRVKHHHFQPCLYRLPHSSINPGNDTRINNHHNVRKETGRRPGTASGEAAECGHESRSHPPGRVGERRTHPDGMPNRSGAHEVVMLPR